METYLISKADIKTVRPFSTNIPDANINPFILDAQNLDIKNSIGDGLLIRLLTYLTTPVAGSVLDKLYNGCDYTIAGNTVTFRHIGLKTITCLYAFARFQENSESVVTQFGTVVKRSEYSDPASEKQLNRSITASREAAFAYLKETKAFIENNINDYTEYLGYFKTDKRGSNISIIGR